MSSATSSPLIPQDSYSWSLKPLSSAKKSYAQAQIHEHPQYIWQTPEGLQFLPTLAYMNHTKKTPTTKWSWISIGPTRQTKLRWRWEIFCHFMIWIQPSCWPCMEQWGHLGNSNISYKSKKEGSQNPKQHIMTYWSWRLMLMGQIAYLFSSPFSLFLLFIPTNKKQRQCSRTEPKTKSKPTKEYTIKPWNWFYV